MSSHHIVRDQQEPALLVLHLTGFPLPILHDLLEWSPTVTCVENTIDEYIQLGHKLDVAVICSEWNDLLKEKLEPQSPINIIMGDNQIQIAVEYLISKNHKAINIIISDKEVHTILRNTSPWQDLIDIVLFTEKQRMLVIRKPEYSKWITAGSEISVMALTKDTLFDTEGFETNLKAEKANNLVALNRSKEGEIIIRSNQLPFIISESL